MKNKIELSLVLCLLAGSVYGADMQDDRKRIPSVKKAIANVSEVKEVHPDKISQTDTPQAKDDVKETDIQGYEKNTDRKRIPSVKKAIVSVGSLPQKEQDIVSGFRHMFTDGKVSGQIRSIYSRYNISNATNTYATAIGGYLKYELAQYNGFSAGVSMLLSSDISYLSGDGNKRNTELSSSDGEYVTAKETYINYKYDKFNLRIGRQIIDTPLADSDDFRMVPNSFQAAVATYKNDALSVMAGYIQKWQGNDTGLDDEWIKTGKDGTYFSGVVSSSKMLDANLWYYRISGVAGDETANNSFYADMIGNFDFSEDISFHLGAQYLYQSEMDKSGVEADIYGFNTELVLYGLGLNMAYNYSKKHLGKTSFSGFGGGTLFTSMDSMILDTITADRDAYSVVGGLSYSLGDFNLLYAYGDFRGDKDSNGVKEHIVEQNIGFEYSKDDEFKFAAIYVNEDDKYDTGVNGGDWGNIRFFTSYSF